MKIYVQDLDVAREAIKRRDVKIGVVGLGSVGLVVAAAFIYRGFRVNGFDVDLDRIKRRIESDSTDLHPEEIVRNIVRRGFREDRLSLREFDRESIAETDVFIVIVPVTLRDGRADLENLRQAIETIGSYVSRGSVIVVESTVPPGTTRGLVKRVLESRSGMSVGVDLGLAYSPERVSIGRAFEDLVERYPKIVAGIDFRSREIVAELYSQIASRGVLRASSLEVAEFEKIAEGVYRDVNIALANSLAEIARVLGVDFWEARELANSQPYSHIHAPGVGVGGICIPYYPRFLIQSIEDLGLRCWCTTIIEQARNINSSQPFRVVDVILEGLERLGLRDRESVRVSILGLSYRGDIPDTRETPTRPLATALLERGFKNIIVHDPLIDRDDLLERQGVLLTRDLEKAVRKSSVIIVATDHSFYKNLSTEDLVRLSGEEKILIFDGRNVVRFKRRDIESGIKCLYGGVGRAWTEC